MLVKISLHQLNNYACSFLISLKILVLKMFFINIRRWCWLSVVSVNKFHTSFSNILVFLKGKNSSWLFSKIIRTAVHCTIFISHNYNKFKILFNISFYILFFPNVSLVFSKRVSLVLFFPNVRLASVVIFLIIKLT